MTPFKKIKPHRKKMSGLTGTRLPYQKFAERVFSKYGFFRSDYLGYISLIFKENTGFAADQTNPLHQFIVNTQLLLSVLQDTQAPFILSRHLSVLNLKKVLANQVSQNILHRKFSQQAANRYLINKISTSVPTELALPPAQQVTGFVPAVGKDQAGLAVLWEVRKKTVLTAGVQSVLPLTKLSEHGCSKLLKHGLLTSKGGREIAGTGILRLDTQRIYSSRLHILESLAEEKILPGRLGFWGFPAKSEAAGDISFRIMAGRLGSTVGIHSFSRIITGAPVQTVAKRFRPQLKEVRDPGIQRVAETVFKNLVTGHKRFWGIVYEYGMLSGTGHGSPAGEALRYPRLLQTMVSVLLHGSVFTGGGKYTGSGVLRPAGLHAFFSGGYFRQIPAVLKRRRGRAPGETPVERAIRKQPERSATVPAGYQFGPSLAERLSLQRVPLVFKRTTELREVEKLKELAKLKEIARLKEKAGLKERLFGTQLAVSTPDMPGTAWPVFNKVREYTDPGFKRPLGLHVFSSRYFWQISAMQRLYSGRAAGELPVERAIRKQPGRTVTAPTSRLNVATIERAVLEWVGEPGILKDIFKTSPLTVPLASWVTARETKEIGVAASHQVGPSVAERLSLLRVQLKEVKLKEEKLKEFELKEKAWLKERLFNTDLAVSEPNMPGTAWTVFNKVRVNTGPFILRPAGLHASFSRYFWQLPSVQRLYSGKAAGELPVEGATREQPGRAATVPLRRLSVATKERAVLKWAGWPGRILKAKFQINPLMKWLASWVTIRETAETGAAANYRIGPSVTGRLSLLRVLLVFKKTALAREVENSKEIARLVEIARLKEKAWLKKTAGLKERLYNTELTSEPYMPGMAWPVFNKVREKAGPVILRPAGLHAFFSRYFWQNPAVLRLFSRKTARELPVERSIRERPERAVLEWAGRPGGKLKEKFQINPMMVPLSSWATTGETAETGAAAGYQAGPAAAERLRLKLAPLVFKKTAELREAERFKEIARLKEIAGLKQKAKLKETVRLKVRLLTTELSVREPGMQRTPIPSVLNKVREKAGPVVLRTARLLVFLSRGYFGQIPAERAVLEWAGRPGGILKGKFQINPMLVTPASWVSTREAAETGAAAGFQIGPAAAERLGLKRVPLVFMKTAKLKAERFKDIVRLKEITRLKQKARLKETVWLKVGLLTTELALRETEMQRTSIPVLNKVKENVVPFVLRPAGPQVSSRQGYVGQVQTVRRLFSGRAVREIQMEGALLKRPGGSEGMPRPGLGRLWKSLYQYGAAQVYKITRPQKWLLSLWQAPAIFRRKVKSVEKAIALREKSYYIKTSVREIGIKQAVNLVLGRPGVFSRDLPPAGAVKGAPGKLLPVAHLKRSPSFAVVGREYDALEIIKTAAINMRNSWRYVWQSLGKKAVRERLAEQIALRKTAFTIARLTGETFYIKEGAEEKAAGKAGVHRAAQLAAAGRKHAGPVISRVADRTAWRTLSLVLAQRLTGLTGRPGYFGIVGTGATAGHKAFQPYTGRAGFRSVRTVSRDREVVHSREKTNLRDTARPEEKSMYIQAVPGKKAAVGSYIKSFVQLFLGRLSTFSRSGLPGGTVLRASGILQSVARLRPGHSVSGGVRRIGWPFAERGGRKDILRAGRTGRRAVGEAGGINLPVRGVGLLYGNFGVETINRYETDISNIKLIKQMTAIKLEKKIVPHMDFVSRSIPLPPMDFLKPQPPPEGFAQARSAGSKKPERTEVIVGKQVAAAQLSSMDISRIADKVFIEIERKIKLERQRRGL